MDLRNQCAKFLSAECPNNCHYDDGCKYYEELLTRFYESKDEGYLELKFKNKYWR